MLSQTFHSHLRDIPLVQLSTSARPAASNEAATTLGSVFKSSRFSLFLTTKLSDLHQPATFKQLVSNLESLLASREKTTDSPSKHRRLFGFKKSTKTKPLSVNGGPLSVIIFNIDAVEGECLDFSFISSTSFYYVAPLPYNTKVVGALFCYETPPSMEFR